MRTRMRHEVKVTAGMMVAPDNWTGLRELVAEDVWDKADYRIATGHVGGIESVAVNVAVTSRKVRWENGGPKVRVKITFVGDGEPDTASGGWLYLRHEDAVAYADEELAAAA